MYQKHEPIILKPRNMQIFIRGKKFQHYLDQSESSCGICVISLGGGRRYECDISQSESSKFAESKKFAESGNFRIEQIHSEAAEDMSAILANQNRANDTKPQEGVVFKANQSESSIGTNSTFSKFSLSPTLIPWKIAQIPLISEIILDKLLNNKIFQMSNSEFNLPSINLQADKYGSERRR